jgi:hypothetical protein
LGGTWDKLCRRAKPRQNVWRSRAQRADANVSTLAYRARYISAMAQPAKSVLQVDDEAELLEPLRMSLRDNGIDVDAAGFWA